MENRDQLLTPAECLERVSSGQSLARGQSRALFEQIMLGRVPTELLCAILSALARRGETADEIAGAAEVMREKSQRVALPPDVNAIDTCGTGGDGKPTFNVSSAAAIVAAAAGATVAKHGNRSHARPSGSAEGLRALGVNIDADVGTVERCLRECRVGFLFAPNLHPAMRFAAEARKRLGGRTIFNLLGPLTNPARVKRQLLGVSRLEHVERFVAALKSLGAERALVVHGLCGVCDITLDGPTMIGTLDGADISFAQIEPSDLGLSPRPLNEVFVGSSEESAKLIRGVLGGERGAARDTVLANAGGALWVAGLVSSLEGGVQRAREAIDSGGAKQTLERWAVTSRG